MWSYREVKIALTKAYAAWACGENLATAVRGPRSTPTVTRTTRSSLLRPVTAKETSACSAARVARAARHLRVAPRRGRSLTWTTTVSGSARLACASNASAPVALCSMLIAPCHLLGEKSALCPRQRSRQHSPCHTQFWTHTSAEVARVDAHSRLPLDTLAASAKIRTGPAMQICQAGASSDGTSVSAASSSADVGPESAPSAATPTAVCGEGANAARAPRLSAVTCAARRLAS